MRYLVSFAFVVVAVLLYYTATRGRAIYSSHAGQPIAESITTHQRLATITWWFMLSAVVLTELFVRLQGGAKVNNLFVVHLCMALPFFIGLTILRFWLTGTRKAEAHRPLAYLTLVLFIGTFVTGQLMLFIR